MFGWAYTIPDNGLHFVSVSAVKTSGSLHILDAEKPLTMTISKLMGENRQDYFREFYSPSFQFWNFNLLVSSLQVETEVKPPTLASIHSSSTTWMIFLPSIIHEQEFFFKKKKKEKS